MNVFIQFNFHRHYLPRSEKSPFHIANNNIPLTQKHSSHCVVSHSLWTQSRELKVHFIQCLRQLPPRVDKFRKHRREFDALQVTDQQFSVQTLHESAQTPFGGCVDNSSWHRHDCCCRRNRHDSPLSSLNHRWQKRVNHLVE